MHIFYLAGFKNKKEIYKYMKFYSSWLKYEISLKLLYCYMHTYNFFKMKSLKTLEYNSNNSIGINGLLHRLRTNYPDKFLIRKEEVPKSLIVKDEFCEAVISKEMIKQVLENIYPYYELISKLNRPTATLILNFIFGN